MKIKEGLSNYPTQQNNLQSSPSIPQSSIGKVYGVINTINTPTEDLFNTNGGYAGIGTIFYLNYEQSKNIDKVDIKTLSTAKPFFPNIKYYPVLGELVLLLDLPSTTSQISNTSSEKYYISVINLWNNPHHNSQLDILGKVFNEKDTITPLQTFEGDFILESRFGAGLRFGSTNKLYKNINNWSNVGEDGSPITILTNGLKNSLNPIIENINEDGSSIYLSSTQQIQLIPDKNDSLNNLTKPIKIDKYLNNQVILNSDRIVINSKKDDLLLFAKTNIELSTKNIINLNSDERVHLNTPKVFLGSNSKGELPTEPLLLGAKTVELLTSMIKSTHNFCSTLSEAMSTPEGTPLLDINTASTKLMSDLESILIKLNDIISINNFTS